MSVDATIRFFLLSTAVVFVSACSASHSSEDSGALDDGTTLRFCGNCGAPAIRWGTSGGLVCTRDTSWLSNCRWFAHERVGEGCDPTDLECRNEIGTCEEAGVDGGDVQFAVRHPDVIEAAATAPVLYGEDPRPDGALSYIEINESLIEVGPDCSSPGCTPVPAAVRELEHILFTLTEEQMVRGACASVFGP